MSSPAASTASDAVLMALAQGNPFSHHRVTATGTQPVDVPSIHDAEFRKLTGLAGRAHAQNEAVGAVVWGESGSGKTNLLRRLGEWAGGGKRGYLVNFLELQTAPDKLHRAVLNAAVSVLTNGLSTPWHKTPLYVMLEGVVRPALPRGKKTVSAEDLHQAFRAQTAELAGEAGSAPAARAAVGLLGRFLEASLTEKSRHGGGGAALAAARRLGGDGLDEDEAKAAGLRTAEAAEPLDPADSICTLAVLSQLARASGKPLILCFDQINTLPRQQVGDVARLLHDLNDRLRNALIVLSEVQDELENLTHAGVISQATWDRLVANKVNMPRLSMADGRRILEARLEGFFRRFEDVPAVGRHLKRDTLFPLGEGWFRGWSGDAVDIRPRRLVDIARERWEEVQATLEAVADKATWLADWPSGGVVPPPIPRPLQEQIDERVGKAVGDRRARHAAAPSALPPNADNLRGLAESLLATGGVGLAVERVGRGSPYGLLVRVPRPGGGEASVGLAFVATGSTTSVTSALGKLAGDGKPPERVILVTDSRQPLAFGRAANAQGRNHFGSLQAQPGFAHVELPFAEYAAMEALDAVARQASDLEVDPPGGPPRPLKRDEVIASYRRARLLEAHPLLGRFVGDAPPRPTPGTALTDEEVRKFVAGRLALTVGSDTHELARQLLNGLPAERRVGLDEAACRSRVEAIARVMAAAQGVAMTPLGDGFFLLPTRRPATV